MAAVASGDTQLIVNGLRGLSRHVGITRQLNLRLNAMMHQTCMSQTYTQSAVFTQLNFLLKSESMKQVAGQEIADYHLPHKKKVCLTVEGAHGHQKSRSQSVVMELVILKARAQLNRLVSSPGGGRSARGGERERQSAGEGGAARAAGRAMAPAPAPAPASAAPWFNATLAYNATRLNLTFDTDYELLSANSTEEHNNHWFCAKWTNAQQDLFQAANLCFAIAFLAPKSFKQSILVLRALAAAGAVLMGMWAGAEVCTPDVLAWSLALVLVNSIHTVFLIIRFLPPALSLELTDLYLKLFKPLKVNKKHFQELTREARIVRFEPGEAYAVEEVTPADERLSILLKGKMRVSCDETHLHYIQPYQFVDSPEWEANREQSDDVFQVTVVAEDLCTCICWPRMRLERVLRHRPALKVVLDCLIGKDITHKLYSVSEGLGTGAGNERDGPPSHLTRSASVDAVHEGSRGKLRSLAWRARTNLNKGSSYWQPVVARQFLRQSPFGRSVTQPRLLPQASSASLQPGIIERCLHKCVMGDMNGYALNRCRKQSQAQSTAQVRFIPAWARSEVCGGREHATARRVTRAAAPARAGAAVCASRPYCRCHAPQKRSGPATRKGFQLDVSGFWRWRQFHTSVVVNKTVAFNLSDIGEGIREVVIKEWFVKVGDNVQQFDNICEVQSDKAAVTISSRYDGVIKKLYHKVDEIALVGQPLVDIETDATDEGDAKETSIAEDSEPRTVKSESKQRVKVLTTPAVRRIASQFKVNFGDVKATGRNGRVMKEDVLSHLNITSEKSNEIPEEVSTVQAMSLPITQARAHTEMMLDDRTVSVSGFTKAMVKSMTESMKIPHFGFCDEYEVTKLVESREILKSLALDHGVKLTYMPIIIKAASLSLTSFPVLNSSLDSTCENITYKASHNIGVAMDTPNGLVVPVIK
ncbi:hypothetical protein ACJJTC_008931, partial [Scirpophaga incertulas]